MGVWDDGILVVMVEVSSIIALYLYGGERVVVS